MQLQQQQINNNFSMRMTFYPNKNQSCGFFYFSIES